MTDSPLREGKKRSLGYLQTTHKSYHMVTKSHGQTTDLTFLVWVFFYPANEVLNLLIYFLFKFHISTLHLYNRKGCINKKWNWRLKLQPTQWKEPYRITLASWKIHLKTYTCNKITLWRSFNVKGSPLCYLRPTLNNNEQILLLLV